MNSRLQEVTLALLPDYWQAQIICFLSRLTKWGDIMTTKLILSQASLRHTAEQLSA